ncbi:MAG: hypothetical protein HYZ37_07825 [Candidatus Solibacter usitatus]|nr:hypothetical protein [Candidatus Solibacter usitatus]
MNPLHFLDPVRFARESLAFHPDSIQCEVLRSNSRRCLLNCTRQWGKSTIAAIIALHRALFLERSLILCISPSERQSAELIRKAKSFLEQMNIRPKSDNQNKSSIVLPNNSRIVGLPCREQTIRGFSAVSLLLIDEAARVPKTLYHAVRPMLAVSNGDLWMMSTPNGRQGFFYDAWMSPEWHKIELPATKCPRFSRAFLDEERQALGEPLFSQEYLCQFTDPEGSLFSYKLLEPAFTEKIQSCSQAFTRVNSRPKT